MKKAIPRIYFFLLVVALVIVISYWFFRADKTPGLHGDEAWFGLEAIEYAEAGISSIHGMNSYTGNLQSVMAMLSFRLLGISVFALRLPGILINSLSLIMIVGYLLRHVSIKASLVFVLLYGQSIFYLTYAKVAWEVTSLSVLFTLFYCISIHKAVTEQERTPLIWVFISLFCGLMGAYNHVIFSCVTFSISVGLWIFYVYSGKKGGLPVIILSTLSFGNFVLFFLFLNRVAWVKGDIGYVLFIVALIGAFIVQSWLFRHKIEYVTAINLRLSSAVRKAAIIIVAVLLLLGMNIFIYFHGWALFNLVLGEKVFIRVFSSDVGLSFLMFSIANALAFIVLLGGFLYWDLSKKRNMLFVLPLFCYLAIFPIYTLNASPRYYLSLLVVLMVYLAIKLAIVLEGSRYFGIVLAALLAGFCISHGLVWSASFKTGGFQPKIFKFGRKGVENSAHFLPMWPIVDSLLTRNVGHFESSKSHFIMGPISFYKYIYPELTTADGRVEIEYDFERKGTGFRVNIIESGR